MCLHEDMRACGYAGQHCCRCRDRPKAFQQQRRISRTQAADALARYPTCISGRNDVAAKGAQDGGAVARLRVQQVHWQHHLACGQRQGKR